MPLEVARILAGEVPAATRGGVKWVRRRRWARIMRRRIDIPHWGFDDDPESETSATAANGSEEVDTEEVDFELPPVRDYLERAQYFAGTHTRRSGPGRQNGANDAETISLRSVRTVIADGQSDDVDRSSGRRIIARLERALQELHEGLEGEPRLGADLKLVLSYSADMLKFWLQMMKMK